MLIPLSELGSFRGRSVLHVGAHACEEAEAYANAGIERVIWVEANPQLVREQRAKGFEVYEALVSDTTGDTVPFFVTTNTQSSSMLPLAKHLEFYPDIVVKDILSLETITLADLAKKHAWPIEKLTWANFDLQGMELRALKGLGKLIDGLQFIYTEVETAELYKGCGRLHELDEFLGQCGFERTHLRMTDQGWGDAFYQRRPVLALTVAAAPDGVAPVPEVSVVGVPT
jgi:FkbM family methyltransferase